MKNMLSIKLDANRHRQRIGQFYKLILGLPGWQTASDVTCRWGTLPTFLDGSEEILPLSCDENKSVQLEKVLFDSVSESDVVKIEVHSDCFVDSLGMRSPLDFVFRGINSDYRTSSPRRQFGDCSLEVDGHLVNYHDASWAEVRDGQASHCDETFDLGRELFREYVFEIMLKLSPHTLFVNQSLNVMDGPFSAFCVFHKNNVEYYRDLLRSVVLLDQYIAFALRETSGVAKNCKALCYYDSSLDCPEASFSPDRIRVLGRNLASGFQALEKHSSDWLQNPLCDQTIVDLAQKPEPAFQAIESCSPASLFRGFESDTRFIQVLGDSVGVYHMWKKRRASFVSVYHSLVDHLYSED